MGGRRKLSSKEANHISPGLYATRSTRRYPLCSRTNNKAGTDKWIAKTATEDVNYSVKRHRLYRRPACDRVRIPVGPRLYPSHYLDAASRWEGEISDGHA